MQSDKQRKQQAKENTGIKEMQRRGKKERRMKGGA
jgi:hypothetical protein